MAEERGLFDLRDVLDSICAKMIRRHPHVFGDGQSPGWEEIKASERAGKSADSSALAGVTVALPALLRAEKLQKRAARTGFDWPEAESAREKIDEEMAEVLAADDDAHRFEEMGDLLFAVVNWSRKLGIDPEAALRAANGKFERRFRAMEAIAGEAFTSLDLDAQEALWLQAKQAERG
jgi:ATP diphosphatase